MSSLLRKLLRPFPRLRPIAGTPVDPESMSLREWADLPVHHPLGERAPR